MYLGKGIENFDKLPVAPGRMWVSDDKDARVTGEYFYHKRVRAVLPAARDTRVQDLLLAECSRLSGVKLPE